MKTVVSDGVPLMTILIKKHVVSVYACEDLLQRTLKGIVKNYQLGGEFKASNERLVPRWFPRDTYTSA